MDAEVEAAEDESNSCSEGKESDGAGRFMEAEAAAADMETSSDDSEGDVDANGNLRGLVVNGDEEVSAERDVTCRCQ